MIGFSIIPVMQRFKANLPTTNSPDNLGRRPKGAQGQASVSVDLDNEWAYLKTQGVNEWTGFPSYLPGVVPRMLEDFDAAGIDVTFFVVGRDAALPDHGETFDRIANSGHEIANHSFMHEPWLHLYSRDELRDDFDKSESAIAEATGRRPVGFRGPGFSSSPLVRETLVERGYQYDASVFPTSLGPVARAYFLLKSNLSSEEKRMRRGLYGGISNAFSSLRPHVIVPGLVEVPVTTMPVTRFPVHLSYLFFLARYSEALARLYWRTTVALCSALNVGPSVLLHPTDFIDHTDAPRMKFFPGIEVPSARKRELVRFVLGTLTRNWQTGTIAAHARTAVTRPAHTPILEPSSQSIQ